MLLKSVVLVEVALLVLLGSLGMILGILDVLLNVLYVAGGFWAVILSWAAWKKSWAGRDPTHSIILMDRSVAITGDTARAQLLTA